MAREGESSEPLAGNVRFYMLFNKNLLNEEKLRRLLEEKEAELAHQREERTRRQEEHEGYVKLRDTLREQKVTEQLYESVRQEIRDIEEECAELAAAGMQAKESVLNLRREEKSLEDGLRTLEREAARRELQTEELRELTDAYDRYVAKKNNTQLICLTGLGGESIYNRFDNIYVLNLVDSRLNRVRYLKSCQIAGKTPDAALSLARIEVAADEGRMESLF